jgi:hypothetical protein
MQKGYSFRSVARYRQFSAPKEKFPWLLFLAVVVLAGVFFALPKQMGPSTFQVDFTQTVAP